jgi:hypothetical protein
MALKLNPNFNPALGATPTNQQYVFEDPNQVINPLTGQTAAQAVGTAPITVESLAPATSFPITYPKENPIYPVDKLSSDFTPMTLTQPETEASDMIKRLRALTEENIGQSAYRATQETAQGIPELQKTQTDLSGRLKALQNEALAIPMQLQQEAQGRGITAGGLQPIQTAALRNNAIQSLSISSLLEASRGNLTLANDLVDRAVAQKFDPIKEQITALQTNLNYILNSPEYSLADKNRAQQQLDIQNKKKAEADAAAALMKDINATAIEAAKSGATADVLNNILGATSLEEAIFYAGDSLGAEFRQKAEQLAYENKTKAEQQTFNNQMDLENLGINKAQLGIQQSANALAWEKFRAEGIAADKVSDATATTPEKIEEQKSNLQFLLDTVDKAKEKADASGRSGTRKFIEGALVGATNYTALAQYTDTLRTNLLTLATDPNIKKFFGPQMSNADVRLMQAAASTLNPETLNPEQMKTELERVKGVFQRLSNNLSGGQTSSYDAYLNAIK